MLRNLTIAMLQVLGLLLNEVLSLNAQEFGGVWEKLLIAVILNEVLSLNAQEFGIA